MNRSNFAGGSSAQKASAPHVRSKKGAAARQAGIAPGPGEPAEAIGPIQDGEASINPFGARSLATSRRQRRNDAALPLSPHQLSLHGLKRFPNDLHVRHRQAGDRGGAPISRRRVPRRLPSAKALCALPAPHSESKSPPYRRRSWAGKRYGRKKGGALSLRLLIISR